MTDIMQVFDRNLVRLRRERAAATLRTADFLYAETAERLSDRLLDMNRSFPRALDLGCHTGQLAAHIQSTGKVDLLFQADLSASMAEMAQKNNQVLTFCTDEEFYPVASEALDLVLSNLSLHWVNDLPGALAQIRRSLKPDGLLLATMFGGETLKEFREVLTEAEFQSTGGVTPRISPFVDVREAGNLLSRAGFALPVVDAENIEVTYENAFKLMKDLREMGETNAILERKKNAICPLDVHARCRIILKEICK